MHDSQDPDDEDLDGINEDFDFGEEAPLSVVEHAPRQPLNKSVLFALVLLVLATLIGVGFRFLPLKKRLALEQSLERSVAQTSPLTAAGAANPSALPTVHPEASTTTHPTTLDKAFAETDKEPQAIPEAHKALFANNSPAAPAKPTETSPGLSAELVSKLQDALKTLNQQIDTIFSKMNYLDAYTQDLSQHVERLNQSVAAMDQRLSNANALMDQRLSSLNHTTAALSKDVGGVRNEVSHVRETLKDEGLDRPPVLRTQQNQMDAQQSVSMDNPEYTVHAVIPGRAWLKSTKGSIITVAEGDSLGNYGKVLVIDAAHGLVLTSSGITFR